jgi:ribosome maturation factor RimP
MTFKEKVTTLLTEGLLEKPSIFDDLIITDAFKVIVTLDGDNGVVLQDCIDVSKFMDSNLDREEQDYSLVASVGVDSLLKLTIQENIGRTLIVKTSTKLLKN